MKRLLILAALLTGCDAPDAKKTETKFELWTIIEIDGCDYIQNNSSRASPLIHHAGCKNPVHQGR